MFVKTAANGTERTLRMLTGSASRSRTFTSRPAIAAYSDTRVIGRRTSYSRARAGARTSPPAKAGPWCPGPCMWAAPGTGTTFRPKLPCTSWVSSVRPFRATSCTPGTGRWRPAGRFHPAPEACSGSWRGGHPAPSRLHEPTPDNRRRGVQSMAAATHSTECGPLGTAWVRRLPLGTRHSVDTRAIDQGVLQKDLAALSGYDEAEAIGAP